MEPKALNLLIKYRLSHGLLIPDALIAATALHVEQSFISKNQRDYCFIAVTVYPPSTYAEYCSPLKSEAAVLSLVTTFT